MKTEAEKKKEKPVPKQCICGKTPADVKTRRGGNAHLPISDEMYSKPSDTLA